MTVDRDKSLRMTRRPLKQVPLQVDRTIDVCVRVSDGSWESKLSIPVKSSPEQFQAAGEMWFGMMLNAVKLLGAPEERR
jgi:hypothetical protein